MTSNKEDYLKVLYEEGGPQKAVPNRVLSERLDIAPASVSEMLTKLRKQGLISYEAYKGARLTEAGLAACMNVVFSHRLWEVFLIRHLGYSWRQAHEDAHLLEHATTARMAERLNLFLNYPATCPHGAVIPQNSGVPDASELFPMTELHEGEAALVCQVAEEGELLDYLEEKGLQIGMSVQVTARDGYEGPVTFLQQEHSISISYKAASQVFVRLQPPKKE